MIPVAPRSETLPNCGKVCTFDVSPIERMRLVAIDEYARIAVESDLEVIVLHSRGVSPVEFRCCPIEALLGDTSGLAAVRTDGLCDNGDAAAWKWGD